MKNWEFYCRKKEKANSKQQKNEARVEPHFLLVNQLVALASKSWKEYAITVAALDSYLENFEIWFQVIFHICSFLRVIKLLA